MPWAHPSMRSPVVALRGGGGARRACGGLTSPEPVALRGLARVAYSSAVRIVRASLSAALLTGALIVAGCARDGRGSGGATSAAEDAGAVPTLVDPDEFAARIGGPDVVTINVHTPNEGSIAGTDLVVPFDEIAESSELPADRSTPLAVYCRSGNMSADAVDDLVELGYTDIVELDGGFDAWEASGRPLEPADD